MIRAPYSAPLRLADIGLGRSIALRPSPAERARIGRALDLAALDRLEGELRIAPWLDGAEITGAWRAEAVQTCGVTLDPLPVSLSGRFALRVVPAGSPHAPSPDVEIELDPDAPDPSDVLDADGVLDLGVYLVEQLALELDPFPRKPDAVFEPPEADPAPSPFAALAALKRD